jgi:hypothetical protein
MFLILVFLSAALAQAQTADLIVENAFVYTLDASRPKTSALAVRGDRILVVGEEAASRAGPGTRRIDAHGLTIVPGFIDSHAHMLGLGESLEMLDLRGARSAEEAAALVARAAAERPEGSWIRGRGWDQTRWPGREFPDARPLDRAAPRHPVFLSRVDGHAAGVNGRALEIAGVTARSEDPPGGRIHRDSAGNPTGILIDRAQGLVGGKIPPPGREEIRGQLARAAAECARLGLTGVHDAGVSREVLEAYRELIAAGRLPVRIYAMIGGAGDLWEEYVKAGPEAGARLTVRSVKLMADGALGSRGAALKEPYADEPGNRGLMILDRGRIESVARVALRAGFQVNTHAIGDRANREVLDAYAAALGGARDRRFRIEHAQVVAPEDFELFARFGVLPVMQATHATSDMRWAEERLGPERVRGAYAWRRFLSMGLPVPNGSDFPVEDPNPLWGFYAAVTRQDHEGRPEGGWMPDQRMTRQEALKSWTLDSAYAAFEEKDKGSLEPGKLADFVMLSQDIMTVPPREILAAHVVMTVVGGAIVHREP